MEEDENSETVKQGLQHIMKTNEIKLWSEATSLFDVRRWTFDVRCSI